MALKQAVTAAVTATAVGVFVLGGMLLVSQRAHAQDSDSSLAKIGMSIAPVKLTITWQDPNLVGLGSFIVNAQSDCNGCHTSSPATQYLDPGNPYFNQHPTKVNPAQYLSGGQDFGPVGAGIANGVTGAGPDIISRNLTPDYTGLPEGGRSFAQFLNIMRTGHDYDQLHLNCSTSVTNNCYTATPGNEIDGALLQVMPWPAFQAMTDNQILAIWTYLSTVPCIANAPTGPTSLGALYPVLVNQCTKPKKP